MEITCIKMQLILDGMLLVSFLFSLHIIILWMNEMSSIVINRILNNFKSPFIPVGVSGASHNKIFEDLFNKKEAKLQRLGHRHAVINGRKVPREKRSPRRSLFRYHEHARSLFSPSFTGSYSRWCDFSDSSWRPDRACRCSAPQNWEPLIVLGRQKLPPW